MVSVPRVVVPSARSLSLTTFAPVVTATNAVLVIPAAAHLTLTGAAPAVVIPALAGHAARVRRIYVPFAVAAPAPQTVAPRTAVLRLVASAPEVIINDDELAAMLLAA